MRKNNQRKRNSIAKLLSVLFALSIVFGAAGCAQNDDWLDAENNNTQSQSQQLKDEAFEGEFPAPTFKSGEYVISAVTSNATDYTDSNGKVAQSGSENSTYSYDLKITCADDGITARYTFKQIKLTNTINGKEAILLDTETGEMLATNYSPYMDLIGQSFEVKVDGSGEITAINGLDAMKNEKPDTAALINEDDMKALAREIFHPVPDTFAYGTKWEQEFYQSKNTYTISKLSHDLFGITVVSEQPDTYSYSDESQGTKVTFTCTEITPTVGQLWMDQNDRALQELSTYQRSKGTIFYEDYDETYTFVNSISSTTTVTAK